MNAFRLGACVLGLVWCAGMGAAQSDSQTEMPRGLWQTEPDANGIVFHVRTKGCGRALCGRVERVKNRRGYDTPSNAVGQKVLWSLRPQPDGSFFGEVRGAQGQQYPDARVMLSGGNLQLRLCQDNTCKEQTWKRLR